MQNTKIGILGGGQLGRMLIQAGINLDMNISVLDPNPEAPCYGLAKNFVVGSLTDFDTVYNFGKDLDVITIEIEHVNVEALYALEKEGKKVFPQPSAIHNIQDKRLQKEFYELHRLPTADFILVENKRDIMKNIDFLPAFQKLGKGGYDGKGVQKLESEEDLDKAFDAPSVLEKAINIEKEIAVIITRSEKSGTAIFPPVELVFNPKYNLVDYLYSPVELGGEMQERLEHIAYKVINDFELIGTLAIEFFLTKDEHIYINEVAPRPHNSGHHSIEGNFTSQFEQHLRAILNLPLGNTDSRNLAAMVNLVGEANHEGKAYYQGLEKVLRLDKVYPHLYGKTLTKPGRKMGHVCVLAQSSSDLSDKIKVIKENLKVISR